MERINAYEISLRPYAGKFYFSPTPEDYEAAHAEIFGDEDKLNAGQLGRFCVGPDAQKMRVYLIWARDEVALVHEVAHVALELFMTINTNPTDEAAEPFCYLLQQLFEDCRKLLHIQQEKP